MNEAISAFTNKNINFNISKTHSDMKLERNFHDAFGVSA